MSSEHNATSGPSTASASKSGRGRRGVMNLRRLAMVAAVIYLGVVLLLALLETKLVYPIPPLAAGNWKPNFQFEDVEFNSRDGTKLHGWLLSSPTPTSRWIIYCHGNGDQVANTGAWLDTMRTHLPANIFVFDYRGYGRSEGKPDETGVLADGEAALDWVCKRSGLKPSKITLYGRSLGGAVAVHLAASHSAQSLVLERTFTRLTDAAKAHYWWIPVKWVMRNQYPSVEKIGNYRGPLLSSHGDIDTIVPYALGKQLFNAAGSPADKKEFVTLKGVGHNDPDTNEYRRKLVEFLRQHGG